MSHVELIDRAGEQKETSGDVGWVFALKGLRVGECGSFSMLSRSNWSVSAMALVSVFCVVSQAVSCAL